MHAMEDCGVGDLWSVRMIKEVTQPQSLHPLDRENPPSSAALQTDQLSLTGRAVYTNPPFLRPRKGLRHLSTHG